MTAKDIRIGLAALLLSAASLPAAWAQATACPVKVGGILPLTGSMAPITKKIAQAAELAFEHVNLDWEKYVRFDEKYLRPTEVDSLVADASKAYKELGWKASVGPEQLAAIMVDHDIATLEGFSPDKPVGKVWSEAAS